MDRPYRRGFARKAAVWWRWDDPIESIETIDPAAESEAGREAVYDSLLTGKHCYVYFIHLYRLLSTPLLDIFPFF